MLVVTNGSGAGALVSKVLPDATVLAWNDVLHDGPVPTTNLQQLVNIRADFIADSGLAPVDEVRSEFRERNRVIGAFEKFDEVCLFFEHDLYDQLQLAEILHFLSDNDHGTTALTSAVDSVYIGEQTPETVAALLAARQPLAKKELKAGSDFWQTFTSDSHQRLLSMDFDEMPFLRAASRRLVEEYPSTLNGLGRSRQQILECLESGPLDPLTLFKRCSEKEEARYLGDASFWNYLMELERCANPLVTVSPDQFHLPGHTGSFRQQTISLSETGKRVLADKMDNIDLNGCDQWIGGVHITTDSCPRWNPLSEHLVVPGIDKV